jgi:hypothetical protein
LKGRDLQRDPDVKKARQALLENENEFLRNKFPIRTAPLALLLDDECKQHLLLARFGQGQLNDPATASRSGNLLLPLLSGFLGSLPPTNGPQPPYLHKVRSYDGNRLFPNRPNGPPVRLVVQGAQLQSIPLEGQIKVGRTQVIRADSFRLAAGQRFKEKENQHDFRFNYIGPFWELGDDQAPPVGDVDKNGAFKLGVSQDFLNGYGFGERYLIGLQVDYDFGGAEVPFDPGDTTPQLSYTDKYYPILNLNPMMITKLNDDVNPWQIRDSASEKGYDVSCWRWDVLPGVGSYLAWQIEETRFNAFRSDLDFSLKIEYVEDNSGVVDAPAARWSTVTRSNAPPRPMPKTRINRAWIRE